MSLIQSQNRQEMRQIIGRNLACIVIGTATSTVDTTSLIDTISLQPFSGDDILNGRQVVIYDATGSIADGSKSWVSDYAGATQDITCSPAFSANITTGDKFELWKLFTLDEVHDQINVAIMDVTGKALQVKQTETTWTERSKLLYNCLTGFNALSRVEYSRYVDIYKDLHFCDAVWDESVDVDVTASVDTEMKREGNGCLKLVVAAGASANDILATDSINSTDISQCDAIEIWIYSTGALAAGAMQLLLDNTASCASALESLDIPATSAKTWTRHTISLANPYLDTAIISLGIKLITDATNTLYFDHIRAVNTATRRYDLLSPQQWNIARGSTNYLSITPSGKNVTGDNAILRLTGYDIPALLSDDTTDSEVDPAYIIPAVTGFMMLSHAKSAALDIKNREQLGKTYLAIAESKKPMLTTSVMADTRFI